MIRAIATGTVLMVSSACLHTSVPIAVSPEMDAGPLDARIWVSGLRSDDTRNISVRLSRAAHVAVFEIVPGRGTQLLYPRLGQPQLLRAGSNHPYVVPLTGSQSRMSSFATASHTVGSWMQPRHLFLVASASPLDLDAVRWATDGRVGFVAARFASFSANSIMSNLVDEVVPMGTEDWVTDMQTIWPEPPPIQRYTVPVTVLGHAVWLLCGETVIRIPAGTPLTQVQQYLNNGCTITQPREPDQKTATPPDSATGANRTIEDLLRLRQPDTLRSLPPRTLDSLPHRQADTEGTPRSRLANPLERGQGQEGTDARVARRQLPEPVGRAGASRPTEATQGRPAPPTRVLPAGRVDEPVVRGRDTEPARVPPPRTGARATDPDRASTPQARGRAAEPGRASTPQTRTRATEPQRGTATRGEPRAARPSSPPVERARSAQPASRPAASKPTPPRSTEPQSPPRAQTPPSRAEQPERREPPRPTEPPRER